MGINLDLPFQTKPSLIHQMFLEKQLIAGKIAKMVIFVKLFSDNLYSIYTNFVMLPFWHSHILKLKRFDKSTCNTTFQIGQLWKFSKFRHRVSLIHKISFQEKVLVYFSLDHLTLLKQGSDLLQTIIMSGLLGITEGLHYLFFLRGDKWVKLLWICFTWAIV